MSDRPSAENDAPVEEPIEPGWYAYSGGAQATVFHLRETGQWSAHFDNGTANDCGWSYIEQALGVWSLVRLVPASGLGSAWSRGFLAADPDADPIKVAEWNPYPIRVNPPGSDQSS